jgi:hypothetical protein
VTDILAVIGRLQFVFAKTMADNPHEYTIRSKDEGSDAAADYAQLYQAVQEHGRKERWGKNRYYLYLYPGDGWRYWTMGGPRSCFIINRARAAGRLPPRVERQKCKTSAPPERLAQLRIRDLAPRQRRDIGRPSEQNVVEIGERPVADFFDPLSHLPLIDHGHQLLPGGPNPLRPQLGAGRAAISGSHAASTNYHAVVGHLPDAPGGGHARH